MARKFTCAGSWTSRPSGSGTACTKALPDVRPSIRIFWTNTKARRRSSALLAPDGLGIHELTDAKCAEFPPVAGALHPAERQPRIGGHHAVHEDRTRLYFIDELRLLGFVAGPHAGSQAEGRIVGQVDGFRGVFHAKEHGHRAEQLFVEDVRLSRDAGQNGGLVEISGAGDHLAA